VSAIIHKLHELHELCRQIEPDSIALYEVLSRKKWIKGEGFGSGDGADMALDLREVLAPLAEAFGEVYESFRTQLVADHIAANHDKYLP
jgi:hypothetical protein